MKTRFAKKNLYMFNFVLLIAVLLTTFFVACTFMYIGQKNGAKDKLVMLSNRIGEDIDRSLTRLESLSKTLFMAEDFQNAVDDVAAGDSDAVERVYTHFNLIVSQDPSLLKNVVYVPRDGEVLDVRQVLHYGSGYEYIEYNIPSIEEIAMHAAYATGKSFYTPIDFNDGTATPYFAVARNVTDIRTGSYLQRMGIGIIFVSIAQFTETLYYGNVIDGMTFVIRDSEQAVFPTIESDPMGGFSQSYALKYFGWNVCGHYDTAYIWSALADNIVLLAVVLLLTGSVFLVLLRLVHKRSVTALNYLFDNFSDIRTSRSYTPVKRTSDAEVNRVIDGFNAMFETVQSLNDEISHQKNQALRLELEKTAYALKSLTSQINKHFMINVLSILRSLLNLGEVEKMRGCIEALSDFLRHTLSEKYKTSVKRELDHVRAYLDLQRLWHPEIDCQITCDPKAAEFEIPKMILQPIVENSFVHGIKGQGGHIFVSAMLTGDTVVIEVCDDGVGSSDERLVALNKLIESGEGVSQDGGNGLALHNVRQRIKILSDDKSELYLSSPANGGMKTTVRIHIGEENA